MKKVYLKDVPGFRKPISVITIPYTDNLPQKELIPAIKKVLLKQCDHLEKKQKHTIGILEKIVRKIESEEGEKLVSFYINTYCKREKGIATQIKNEEIPAFSNAPENVDYCLDFLDLFDRYYFHKEGVQNDCVFSVVNKERAEEPYVPCINCNGDGKIKCPKCGGSGREQYTDGYYASGKERIKTGNCPECQGYGKIDCPECNGQGKIEIFALHYSIVKSVKEVYAKRILSANTTPWSSECQDISQVISQDERFYNRLHDDLFIRFLKKNKNEITINASQQIIEELEKNGALVYYEKNHKKVEEKFSSETWGKQYLPTAVNEGDLICQQEAHYLLPITRFKIFISDKDSIEIYLSPYDAESICIELNKWKTIKETGIVKYLYYKLFK